MRQRERESERERQRERDRESEEETERVKRRQRERDSEREREKGERKVESKVERKYIHISRESSVCYHAEFSDFSHLNVVVYFTFLFSVNLLYHLYVQVCNHPFLFGEPKDDNGVFLSELNSNMLVRMRVTEK